MGGRKTIAGEELCVISMFNFIQTIFTKQATQSIVSVIAVGGLIFAVANYKEQPNDSLPVSVQQSTWSQSKQVPDRQEADDLQVEVRDLKKEIEELKNTESSESSSEGINQIPLGSILCNGVYWSPCKQGQQFDCPNSGEAQCIIQSTLKLSEPDKTLLQDFSDLLRRETQRLKQEKEYARQQELERLNCLLAPSPEDQRMLSPQQQNYLTEKRCGTSTPASDLNYKLYQQQEYQKCFIKQLTSSFPVSCEHLKPIFY